MVNREIGEEGAFSLQIGDCVGCTGVDYERMQRAGFSSARCALHVTGFACPAMRRAARAGGAPGLELKEHRSREPRELSTRGLQGEMVEPSLHLPVKVPRHGVGRCASAVFLRAIGRSVTISLRPFTSLTSRCW